MSHTYWIWNFRPLCQEERKRALACAESLLILYYSSTLIWQNERQRRRDYRRRHAIARCAEWAETLLCIKGCNFFSTRSFRVASTIVACSSIVPLYCCHYRLRHAAACGAALVNRLSKRYSPLQQDDSNLNFLSSFLMRALMHMRGSRLSHTTP